MDRRALCLVLEQRCVSGALECPAQWERTRECHPSVLTSPGKGKLGMKTIVSSQTKSPGGGKTSFHTTHTHPCFRLQLISKSSIFRGGEAGFSLWKTYSVGLMEYFEAGGLDWKQALCEFSLPSWGSDHEL